jgi:hypothetical protein
MVLGRSALITGVIISVDTAQLVQQLGAPSAVSAMFAPEATYSNHTFRNRTPS